MDPKTGNVLLQCLELLRDWGLHLSCSFGMMPLLLVIFFAEVCTQQLEEILYPTESGFSFIGKGTNPDCGIWQEKKGFRDVWLHQHSSLVFDWVCARPVRRQRGNGPKYHGLLERWARRNCSFDEAFSPSMVKRIWGNSRSLQQSKSSLPRHSSAPGSWWVSVGCSEALELALYAMVKSLSGSPQVPGGKLLQKDVENPWGTPRKMIYRRINHGCFVLFSCLFKWSCILFMVIGNFPIFVIVSTY